MMMITPISVDGTLVAMIQLYSLDLLTAAYRAYCMAQAEPHLRAGRLEQAGSTIRLTRQGIFTSNDIISDLMRA